MRRYSVCGLEIDSEIPVSHFPPGNPGRPADIRLRTCARLHPFKAAVSTSQWRVGPGFVHLLSNNIECVCRAGSEIAVLGHIAQLDETYSVLKRALGVVCYQRGLFVLHAVVVEKQGRAVALTGWSGSGKSTLAAEFFRHGYRLLADDVAACEIHDGVRVHPLYAATRRKSSGSAPAGWKALPGTAKLVSTDVPFCPESRSLSCLFVLHVSDAPCLRVQALNPAQAVPFVEIHSYRTGLARAIVGREGLLHGAAAVASFVQVSLVARPVGCSPALLAEVLRERIERV